MARLKEPRILFVVSVDWYFLSHRLKLAKFLVNKGFKVFVATPPGDRTKEITEAGLLHVPIAFNRATLNPLAAIATILSLARVYRQTKPDIVHLIALKPILLGSLCAKIFYPKAKIVNTVAGLGYSFVGSGIKTLGVKSLIRLSFKLGYQRKKTQTIFQNQDDMSLFISKKFVPESEATLIAGSGVDINHYKPSNFDQPNNKVFILAARMLWYKGIGEYAKAAKIVKRHYPRACFELVGGLDLENRAAVKKEQLLTWQKQGILIWRGHCSDMVGVYSRAFAVVLPSFYREGIPLALLEAAACAKPLVTTDMPGCREVVRDNYNGYLIPTHNAQALANALMMLLANPDHAHQMGMASRQLAVEKFSLEHVNAAYLDVYRTQLKT